MTTHKITVLWQHKTNNEILLWCDQLHQSQN